LIEGHGIDEFGLDYEYQTIIMRNKVERFFKCLKERAIAFYHKLGIKDHLQGIESLKLFLNLFMLYYQTTSMKSG